MPRSSFNAFFAGRRIHPAMEHFLIYYLFVIMLCNVHIDPQGCDKLSNEEMTMASKEGTHRNAKKKQQKMSSEISAIQSKLVSKMSEKDASAGGFWQVASGRGDDAYKSMHIYDLLSLHDSYR